MTLRKIVTLKIYIQEQVSVFTCFGKTPSFRYLHETNYLLKNTQQSKTKL